MKNDRTRVLVALLCGAGAPLACSGGGAVNIGNTETAGAELSDYAATWDGYVEAFNFWPDGSDHVRLTIAANGQGTLQIGDAALLAPPTDPNVGYPPGGYSTWVPFTGTGRVSELVQGFQYPIHAATVQADRIQLGVDPNDLYTDWCPLETPFPFGDPPGYYTCINIASGTMISSNWDGTCTVTMPDQTTQVVDCLKVDLCMPPSTACNCTATGCTANTVPAGGSPSQYAVELDGAMDGTGATLTATLTLADRVTVVLTKQ